MGRGGSQSISHHPTPATMAQHNTHAPGLTPVQWSGASTLAELNPVPFARNRTSIRDAKGAACQESAQLSSEQQGALQALTEAHQQSHILARRGKRRQGLRGRMGEAEKDNGHIKKACRLLSIVCCVIATLCISSAEIPLTYPQVAILLTKMPGAHQAE